jgi:hypothetical protein
MAKVTYTEGRKPKGFNKIDKMAKVTNTGRRKPYISPKTWNYLAFQSLDFERHLLKVVPEHVH